MGSRKECGVGTGTQTASSLEFDFPDELRLLRETANSFLSDHSPPSLARDVIENGAPFDASLWSRIGDMGWLSATVPEEHGGLAAGHLAVCALAEEIGRAVAPVPFSSSVYLAIEALLRFGSEAQQARYLPGLAAGQLIGTVAVTESTGVNASETLRTTVSARGLHGHKSLVADGSIADIAVVAVTGLTDAPSLYLVECAANGVERTPVDTIDPSRGYASMSFDQVPAEPLPGSARGDALDHLLDCAAVMMAFEQIGIAQGALDMACDYARERFAFGRPIGSFQAIKHKLVDVYVAIELARSNAYYGAWALEQNAPELKRAAAGARVSACEAGWLATKENIQTHGGMGFTWDLDCHLFYRRSKLLALTLGSASEWKRKLMRCVS